MLLQSKFLIAMPESYTPTSTSMSFVLEKIYTSIIVDKAQYLHGITKSYRYDSAPTVFIACTVQPAEWYLSPRLLDNEAIRNILQPWYCFLSLTHTLQMWNVCVNSFYQMCTSGVRTKILNDSILTAF